MPGELYAGVNAAICSVLFGFCAFSGPDAGIRRGMVRIAPAGASIWAELSWGQPLTCALQHSTWERAECTDAQGPLPGIPPCSPPPFVLPSLFYDDSAILHIARYREGPSFRGLGGFQEWYGLRRCTEMVLGWSRVGDPLEDPQDGTGHVGSLISSLRWVLKKGEGLCIHFDFVLALGTTEVM